MRDQKKKELEDFLAQQFKLIRSPSPSPKPSPLHSPLHSPLASPPRARRTFSDQIADLTNKKLVTENRQLEETKRTLTHEVEGLKLKVALLGG